MALFNFEKAEITAIATTLGDKKVTLEDHRDLCGFTDDDIKKFKTNLGFESRYIVSNLETCTSDLCVNSAQHIINHKNIDPKDIDAVILITQTPDYRAPSTAIKVAQRLGCDINVMAFDISLGCSGFIYGLSVAFSLIESGLKNIFLLTGDVASHFSDQTDKTFAPLMGDAGSAVYIQKRESSTSHFCLYSDGSGEKHLYIPGSGTRKSEDPELNNFMQMSGADVFNFTIKQVPRMFQDVFDYSNIDKDEIDYFVLHQPNKYILNNIRKRLKIAPEKLPDKTQALYGNQNSASIPGTINAFLSESFQSNTKKKVLFAGFGIGLSWGACVLDINSVYCPEPLIYNGN